MWKKWPNIADILQKICMFQAWSTLQGPGTPLCRCLTHQDRTNMGPTSSKWSKNSGLGSFWRNVIFYSYWTLLTQFVTYLFWLAAA